VNGVLGTATAISASAFHSCAIQSGTGATICWGSTNAHGEAVPPASLDSRSAAAIVAGGEHSLAIRGAGPACSDGIDNDGDGFLDFPNDPGCESAFESDEHSPTADCDDGVDNDGDGFTDDPTDPGCANPASNTENPRCQDGIDNDSDGKFDFDGGASANGGVALGLPDPHCTTPHRNKESANSCGLGGEILFALPLLGALRRRLHAAQ
jgi:hypothetical protein